MLEGIIVWSKVGEINSVQNFRVFRNQRAHEWPLKSNFGSINSKRIVFGEHGIHLQGDGSLILVKLCT